MAWSRVGVRDSQLEGIYFGMSDGKMTKRCFISGGTLDDVHGGAGPAGQAANEATFESFESKIEAAAARKLDQNLGATLTVVLKEDLS